MPALGFPSSLCELNIYKIHCAKTKFARFRFRMLIILLTLFNLVEAQGIENKRQIPFIIEAQYSAGKVVPVYRDFPKTTFANTAEIHLGYQTAGSRKWHKLFNYPRLGISLIFQELGNSKVLGQQISVVPTVYFSTAKKENAKVFAELRYGLGLACFTRPYDSIRNPNNEGAGSYCTWQFTVGSNVRWNISRYLSLQLGGIWYHASNAHTQLPNVGVNNFAVYLGLLATPFGRIQREHSLDIVGLDKKWHVNFRFGSGFQRRGNAFGPIDSKRYPVYAAAIYTSKRLGKVFMVKVGVIYRYYPMYLSFINDYHVYYSKQKLRSSAFIIFIGNEFLLGHFAISLEAGINVYKPAYKSFYEEYEKSTPINYYTKQYLATRFGANYYIFDPYKHPRNNIFVGAYVSANSGQAEFLELNLGYVW